MALNQFPVPTQSGSSVVSIDTVPTSPNADDQEFNATSSSLPTGWSWLNQGTSTYSEASGIGAFAVQAAGADEFRGIVRNIAAGSSFTATFKARVASPRTASGTPTYPSRALILRDSATSKIYAYMHLPLYEPTAPTDADTAIVDYYTNTTTWSSRPGASIIIPGISLMPYLRVKKNSSTSWDFAVSWDGVAWLTTHSAINVSTNMTPDQIGIGVNTRGHAMALGVDWYRVS